MEANQGPDGERGPDGHRSSDEEYQAMSLRLHESIIRQQRQQKRWDDLGAALVILALAAAITFVLFRIVGATPWTS